LKNYYSILGINHHASHAEIKKAFRFLAKKYHPDMNQQLNKSDSHFKEIQEAYSILSDSQKRNFYDQKLIRYKNKVPLKSEIRSNKIYSSKKVPFHYSYSDMFSYRKKTEYINPLIGNLIKQWEKVPWKNIYLTSFIIGSLFCFTALYIEDSWLREPFIYEDKLEAIIKHYSFFTALIYGICYGLGVMLMTVFLITPLLLVVLYATSFVNHFKESSKSKI
jgi:hypothetical protein